MLLTRWERKSEMSIKGFLKAHLLPVVSLILMLLSFFVSVPTGEMIVSLQWNGIAMVAVMTMVVAGLKKERVVEGIGKAVDAFSHTASLLAFFAAFAFILSPFITSLFAVIAILPIAISILKEKEREELTSSFAAVITLAAIAGGTVFPGGSHHNMVLHTALGETSFLDTTLPYFIASIPVMILSIPILLGKRITEKTYIKDEEREVVQGNKGMRMLYVCFAFIAFLTSFSLFKWVDIVIFTIAILLVFDKEVFLKADYSFLLSTIFLLIAGKCLSPILNELIATGEMWKSIVLTELVGGLPVSALLTSTGINQRILLQSVNIGSVGTLLSLPALTALKIVRKEHRKAFAVKYSIISVLLLAVFIIVSVFIN